MWSVFIILGLWLECISSSSESNGHHNKEDRVDNLPGLDFQDEFNQYAGYLRASPHENLFYWFVEAENEPETAPLIIWFNGGPGCSSIDGLLSENGPFLINDDGATVRRNPFSWTKFANIAYVESPVGVGFSYSTFSKRNSDTKTANWNHNALKDFFRKFPELRKNDLYLIGESYGGIYVPTLAEHLLDDGAFNLKGFAIGNGYMDAYLNDKARYSYLFYHGIISEETWNDVIENCCTNFTADECDFSWSDENCTQSMNDVYMTLDGMNPYNIEGECYQQPQQPLEDETSMDMKLDAKRDLDKSKWYHYYTCLNNTAVTTYLNNPNVQTALHVDSPPREWTVCSDSFRETYKKEYESVKDIYRKLLPTNKLKVLVYSGLLDCVCAYLGAEWFLDGLEFEVLDSWSQWTYVGSYNQSQIGGFMRKYAHNLTFATIKGAGHSAPIDKPWETYELISKFILE